MRVGHVAPVLRVARVECVGRVGPSSWLASLPEASPPEASLFEARLEASLLEASFLEVSLLEASLLEASSSNQRVFWGTTREGTIISKSASPYQALISLTKL